MGSSKEQTTLDPSEIAHGKQMNSVFNDCKWIWTPSSEYHENHWVNIRRTFMLPEVDANAVLHISADTDYCMWINGKLVNLGQFPDYPEEKHFDSLAVSEFLTKGKNCLAILGYYQGRDTSRYIEGKAGLIFSLHNNQSTVKSNAECKIRTSPAFKNGPVPLVTRQLGFTIAYDRSRDDDWLLSNYNDESWPAAKELSPSVGGYWKKLEQRPLPKLTLSPLSARITAYGSIKRKEYHESSVAERMANDLLIPESTWQNNIGQDAFIIPPDKATDGGNFIIADLGRESFGYLEIEITASQGTIIDIAHGEHLIDKRVRCHIKDRNFADRYTCTEGRQNWLMPVRRLGCRYLQLHFTNAASSITLHRVGLLRASYPIKHCGSFTCSSELHNRIHKLCVQTLELCMHEHYEDCPWREQALYSNDSRNQALCGYLNFGEYDFPEESFRLLGKSIRPDGYLALCAPTGRKLTIPSFSMIWIVALRDYHLFSGRNRLSLEFADQIETMLKKYMASYHPNGLMVPPDGSDYWNFYEWTPGLAGNHTQSGEQPVKPEDRIESCLNLFLLEALEAAGEIFHYIDKPDKSAFFKQKADLLRKAIQTQCLSNNLLPTMIGPVSSLHNYSQLVQSLLLYNHILPSESARHIREKIAFDKTLEQASISTLLYAYQVLMHEDRRYSELILHDIAEKWGYMLDKGSTSCWETIKGADDFDGAGSLCHGWSAIPTYFYYTYVLGIKPTRPGFKKFSAAPLLEHFDYAEGVVPTPYGKIYIAWQNEQKICIVRHPAIIDCRIEIEFKNWKIQVEKY